MAFALGVTVTTARSMDFQTVIHSHTYEHADLVVSLLEILTQLGCIDASTVFSSIQVNHNTKTLPHKDSNYNPSIAVSFGDFEGGVLMMDGNPVDIFRKPKVIDGQIEHYVTDHTGDRWSLVIFENNRCSDLDEEQKAFLKKLGFSLPGAKKRAAEGR